MRRLLFAIVILLLTSPVFAEKGLRVSFENILTGPAVGTDNLYAFQVEMELLTVGPVDIGWSIRKEGPGSVDGFGLGAHVSRHWMGTKHFDLVTQAGVRFITPGVEYSRFQYREEGGEVMWQRWDRISTNAHVKLPFTDADHSSVGGVGAWGPNLGLFAEGSAGPAKVRVGIRATFYRYGVEVMQRYPGGDLRLMRNDRHWEVIFSPTVTIGF